MPRTGIDPGWLWLVAHTAQAQMQIKALASGSVVLARHFEVSSWSYVRVRPAGRARRMIEPDRGAASSGGRALESGRLALLFERTEG
jgi:hypothetical protein